MSGHGAPYETRSEARTDAQPLRDAMHAATPHDTRDQDAAREAQRTAATDYTTAHLTRHGVQLGAYDEHIAAWLTTWEPETVTVILGWVQRAHQAGRDSASGP